MTRELKLTLVIGFALLLVLGILIADHFSLADERRDQTAESSRPQDLVADLPPATLRETPELPSAPSPQPPPQPSPPAGGNETPRPQGPNTPVPPSPDRTKPIDPVVAGPNEQLYRVAEGDSLSKIAAEFYGDRALWQTLAEFNKDRLPNPNVLRAGLVLRIPDRTVLLGGEASPAGVRDPLSPAPVETARTHVVRDGETLSQIAAATLGSSKRWRELVAANTDRISDPDRVRPGTELRIPVAR